MDRHAPRGQLRPAQRHPAPRADERLRPGQRRERAGRQRRRIADRRRDDGVLQPGRDPVLLRPGAALRDQRSVLLVGARSDVSQPRVLRGGDVIRPPDGTIFDLLERNNVSWADYFQDVPQGASFRPFGTTLIDPHFLPLPVFLAQAAGVGDLPQVSFVDPNFGLFGKALENDEHPPTDIQRGQAFVAQVVNAVRNGPHWADSVIFIVYDEHGGAYDHVRPPHAVPPDAIQPGQCEDLSNPPASLQPGGGAECSDNLEGDPQTSVAIAIQLCPALAADPTGPYPAECAKFDQLGVRVPFIAVSPFAKPQYVSHTVADHTSMLAFVETVFMPRDQHLTERDRRAHNLLDLFDFASSPSLDTPVGTALPPVNDCTPLP
ncbi:MAG: hypothetical protein E6J90_09500 [Deltaproteobacteria bacterium]|nr:MAG: hypothetical protein E6J90_09500 [Deltaproteobacteria bacterium]